VSGLGRASNGSLWHILLQRVLTSG
jgi:hypothetical protein